MIERTKRTPTILSLMLLASKDAEDALAHVLWLIAPENTSNVVGLRKRANQIVGM